MHCRFCVLKHCQHKIIYREFRVANGRLYGYCCSSIAVNFAFKWKTKNRAVFKTGNPQRMLQLAGLKCFLSFLFFSLKIAIHAPSLWNHSNTNFLKDKHIQKRICEFTPPVSDHGKIMTCTSRRGHHDGQNHSQQIVFENLGSIPQQWNLCDCHLYFRKWISTCWLILHTGSCMNVHCWMKICESLLSNPACIASIPIVFFVHW